MMRPHVSHDVDGGVLWDGQSMDRYKLSMVWESIRPKGTLVRWYGLVWAGYRIPRRSVVAWLIINNRITTRDKIKRYFQEVAAQTLPAICGLSWDDMILEACSWVGDSNAVKTKCLLWRILVC
ncbi:hypothetical protein LINPERPRIM_LOCUS37565, partial [Linum perenne]